MKKKNDKIIKFHRQIHINIGVIIFGVILIYVIFHVFSFLTSKNITVYEVNEGTIAENQEYQALAIRQEQIVTAPVAGDIFYFTPDISRAGVRTRICSIDTTGEITDELTAGASDVVDTEALDLSRVSSSIGTFSGEYTDMDFQKVYAFKNSLTAEIQQLSSEYLLQQLADQVATASSAGTFHMLYAQTPGLVVYQTDGYESVTADNFTEEDLDPSRVTVTDLKGQESVTEGQAVYKLVTSDHWELIAEIDEETASKYEDGEYVEIRFPEDQSTTWAQCQIQQKEDRYYLILSMHDSMDRYASSRFIHIEILSDSETGLKIPNSAITEKEFFTIPRDYFYQGNNSSDWGVLAKSEKGDDEFIIPTIYYEIEDYYYVDPQDLPKGTTLQKPDSQDSYLVGSETATLQGVYNVNKGYAVFKQIDILSQTEEYTIVASGTSYGIALYDHIVLQGDEVEENDMIY